MTTQTQMLKGILEGCVLKLISEAPCYSAELVARLRARGFDDMAEGTLFPLLLRLEKEGLFVTERVASRGGPARKYYRLSPAGEQALRDFTAAWCGFRTKIDEIMEVQA